MSIDANIPSSTKDSGVASVSKPAVAPKKSEKAKEVTKAKSAVTAKTYLGKDKTAVSERKDKEIKGKKDPIGTSLQEKTSFVAGLKLNFKASPKESIEEKKTTQSDKIIKDHPKLSKFQKENISSLSSYVQKGWDKAAKAVGDLPDKFVLPDLGKQDINLESELKASKFQSDKTVSFSKSLADENTASNVTIQGKGYLEEGDFCADYASVDHFDKMSLAIVGDAAGNKAESRDSAMKLTSRFRELVVQGLKDSAVQGELKAEDVKNIIHSAVLSLQSEAFETEQKETTMAFALTLQDEKGRTFAIGASIGDARIMMRKADGTVKDMTPQECHKRYSDSGGAFGRETLDTFHVIMEEMHDGDMLLLGSDGFGDNMEAKTLGTKPMEAIDYLLNNEKLSKENKAELKKDLLLLNSAGRRGGPTNKKTQELRWDSFPPKADGDAKYKACSEALQFVHNLFVEAKLEEVTKKSTDPASAGEAVHKHCMLSKRTQRELDLMDISDHQVVKQARKELAANPEFANASAAKINQELNRKSQEIFIDRAVEFAENHLKLPMGEIIDLQRQWINDFSKCRSWVGAQPTYSKLDDFSLVVLEKRK